jgi:dTDP-4-dehydrorhamnose reductase
MKVHILGSTGMLGCYVFKYLKKQDYNVIGYTRAEINALSPNLDKLSNVLSPDDVIVNCIGLLKPNIKSDKEAITVNREFPLILDVLSRNVGCKLINFSSDCVFSGDKGSYTEADTCDAVDIYGLTKTHENIQSTVLRLSFIGEEMINKIGLLEFALKNRGKSITGYTNCLWNGVTGLSIAKIIDRMIRGDGISFWSGVRHVFSDRVVSKYEIISMLNAVYGLNLNIVPIQASEICGTAIKNTLDRSLCTVYNKIAVPSLEEMIHEQRNYIYEN